MGVFQRRQNLNVDEDDEEDGYDCNGASVDP